ncbi:tRNA 2-thiouridine(34) synthase MnmA, partial [Campylobacter upsaliensis]|nr:tRNA 2-thiouridine(34) synthase MnmA [Campylobacter upsaliensis]
NCEVKIRYRSKSVPCEVLVDENLNAQISLKEPVYGLASGQMAVFYEEDRVIASGFIS